MSSCYFNTGRKPKSRTTKAVLRCAVLLLPVIAPIMTLKSSKWSSRMVPTPRPGTRTRSGRRTCGRYSNMAPMEKPDVKAERLRCCRSIFTCSSVTTGARFRQGSQRPWRVYRSARGCKAWGIRGGVGLLRNGANKQARDKDGCTPKDFAKDRRIELLLL